MSRGEMGWGGVGDNGMDIRGERDGVTGWWGEAGGGAEGGLRGWGGGGGVERSIKKSQRRLRICHSDFRLARPA